MNGRTPTARERDAANRAADLHEMTGGILGKPKQPTVQLTEIFDVAASRLG